MTDPAEAAAREAATAAAHLPFLAIGAGAALVRLLTYSGPPRPWRVVLMDGLVMVLVGFGAAEAAVAIGWTLHGAVAAGIAAGLLGWETLKRLVTGRLSKEVK
jgi:hypothetical protein